MKGFLGKLGQEHRYNFARPADPNIDAIVIEVNVDDADETYATKPTIHDISRCQQHRGYI